MPQKGISPIIATIIILLVTIAIAGAGYSYISTYWSGLIGKEIQVVSAFCTGDNQGKVMVKNIGTNPVRTGEITIINPRTGEDLTQDVVWATSVGIDPDLVLELKLDEGSGTTAKDTSGNGNDGTFLPSGSGPTWTTNGKIGKALSFDGVDDVITVDLRNLNLTRSQSIVVWAKPNGPPPGKPHQSVISTDPNYQYGAKLMTYKNYERVVMWIGNGNSDFTAGVNVNINDGRWHFVVGVYDYTNGNIIIFIDGLPYTPITTGQFNINVANVGQIGKDYHNTDYSYYGLIDEVRIYNRVLSQDEIKALYENSVPLQPGETATLTHTCAGVCRYNLVLGWGAKEAMVQC